MVIFLILTIALISISAISAEDVSSLNSTVGVNDEIELETNGLNDGATSNEDVVASNEDFLQSKNGNNVYVDYVKGNNSKDGSNWNSAFQTIEYAVDKVNNGDNIYLAGVTHQVSNKITINKTITIVGQDGTIITNNNNTNALFNIVADNVKIVGCTVVNSSSDKEGGVIHISGDNITFSNSSFINNTAIIYDTAIEEINCYGGAIYNTGNGLTISDSSFINNDAFWGGAIYNVGNNLIVRNSIFISNSATAGGAIINGASRMSVFNSSFINNTADYGGAISNPNENHHINVSNSVFVNNTAKREGEGDAIFNDDVFIANDNWWGNNTPNWNTLIKNSGTVTHDSYVVLNLTSDNNVLYLNSHRNGTDTSVNIPARDVKLTIDGEVFTTKIDSTGFKYLVPFGVYNITAVVDNQFIISNFTGPMMNVTANNIIHGENAVIKINIPVSITGNVTVNLIGQNKTYTVNKTLNGESVVSVNVSDLSVGVYSVNVTYNGNNIYKEFTNNTSFEVYLPKVVYVDYINGRDDNNGSNWNNAIKTIEYAVNNVINGSTIYLAGVTHQIDDLITVNTTISIVGQNGAIITNKHNNKGVFKINASDVKISNCIFVNSSSDKEGGVIYNSGDNFTLTNSSFINNTVIDDINGCGGAIYNEGKGFTLSNSYFINNSAVFGGAIYNVANGFTVSDSSFIKNNADSGGAIVNHGKNIMLYNSSFINNSAKYGGAISNINKNDVNVSNSVFVNNTAKHEGDAIFNDGVFTANDNWWGNNTPNWNRLIKNTGTVNYKSYVVLNLTLNEGVLYLNFYRNGNDTSVNIPVRDVKLTIGNESINGKIVNGTFKTQYTIPSDGYITAIVDNEKLVFAIIHVDYLKGSDENDGLMWGSAVKTIEQANKLVSDVGMIYLAKGTHYVNNQVTINKMITIIGQNEAVITNNCSGYAIFKIISDTVKVDNCIFANSSGNYSIIHNIGDNFVINNSKFINNSIIGDGAAILNEGKYSTVVNSTFIDNTAKGGNFGGGAILNGGVNFKLSNSTFINNTVANDGGAVYNTGVNFTVVGSLFDGNIANGRGGAILNTGVNFTVVGSLFDRNVAKNDNGGAIRNLGTNFTLSNSTFVNNSANYGGSIYNYKASNFTIFNSSFVNNSARYGGAILNEGDNFTVANSSFDGNNVENAGGAIYNYNCTNFKIKSSSFVNNTAKTNAGAIFNDESTGFEIINSYFINNVAKNDNGGAIRNTGDKFLVKNSTFKNNSADFGGAIIDFGANFTIEDSLFVDNVAKYGGAIYTYQNANFTVTNSFFIKNKVNGNGGAIYIYQSTNFTIANSSFVNNSASNIGESIWNSGVLNINNSTFETNKYRVIYNANNASLNLTNNKYYGKMYVYNNGTLTAAIITVLENKTVYGQYGKDISLFASIVDDGVNVIGNSLYFIINGTKIKASLLENGTYFVNYNVDVNGKEIVNASYDGAYKENTVVNTAILDARATPNINISVKDNFLGKNTTIMFYFPNDATGNVSVFIDNKTYEDTLKNGVATIYISGFDCGDYNLTVTYGGDDKYLSCSKEEKITILPIGVILNVDNITMFYKDGTRFVVNITDMGGNVIANSTLSFVINGMTYDKVTDENGTASIALNLVSGIYNAVVLFNGTADYEEASKNVTVNIKSTIDGSNIVKIYQNETQFLALLLDKTGKSLANTNVSFNINGVFYTRQTDVDGRVNLNINLDPGNYTLTAYNPVTGEERGFNVLVKSLIETSDLTKYYMNDSKFEVKVLNKDGSLAINKEVMFNINGVFYTRTSDENGCVKLAINLRPGNYTITTIYGGLSIGNKVCVLPTLETKDLYMNYGDGSMFQAKTLDGQGKLLASQTVTFNVNGVFYQRISGNDGMANLNINLNKGEYIITSMWNDFQVGNKLVIS